MRQVANQANAIGVFPEYPAIRLRRQGIDRSGATGALAERVGQAKGQLLQRNGAIESTATGLEKRPDGLFETLGRNILGGVGQGCAGLLREKGVYPGRLAVADGMAEDGVTVGGGHDSGRQGLCVVPWM